MPFTFSETDAESERKATAPGFASKDPLGTSPIEADGEAKWKKFDSLEEALQHKHGG